ncbi:hypothetical protein MMC18_002317 [Xylographa bjoerkii]|nr:hypothetical protein [Xylographa bjoerkii]
MENGEEYVKEIRAENESVYGPDNDTFRRDPATELETGWTLGYWATLKSHTHITLRIAEMFVFPKDLFEVESSGSSGDTEASNDSNPKPGTTSPPLTIWVLICTYKASFLGPKYIWQTKAAQIEGAFYTHEKVIAYVKQYVKELDRSERLPRGTFLAHRKWGHVGPADPLWEMARWRSLEGDVYSFMIKKVAVV